MPVVNLVQAKSDAVQAYMMHHMMDSHEWAWAPHVHTKLPHVLTVNGAMVIGVAILLAIVLGLTARRKEAVPSGLLNVLEFFAKYIRNEMVIPFLGEKDGQKMAPMFITLFFFILVMNLAGLIPSFCKGFVPPGIPGVMLVMIVPIEVLSMFIRTMALAIRLFANMLAGHLVIYSLLGMIVMFGVYASPAILGALGIYLLEVFVAFLQAYIFTLLSAIFIGERYHPAH